MPNQQPKPSSKLQQRLQEIHSEFLRITTDPKSDPHERVKRLYRLQSKVRDAFYELAFSETDQRLCNTIRRQVTHACELLRNEARPN